MPAPVSIVNLISNSSNQTKQRPQPVVAAPVQADAMQADAMQDDAMQDDAVQDDAVQDAAVQDDAPVQAAAVQDDAPVQADAAPSLSMMQRMLDMIMNFLKSLLHLLSAPVRRFGLFGSGEQARADRVTEANEEQNQEPAPTV